MKYLMLLALVGCASTSVIHMVMPDGHQGADVICREPRYCWEAISNVCRDGFDIVRQGPSQSNPHDLEMVVQCKDKSQ